MFSLYIVNDNALPQGCYMKYLFSRFAAENLLGSQCIYVYSTYFVYALRTSYIIYAYFHEILSRSNFVCKQKSKMNQIHESNESNYGRYSYLIFINKYVHLF